MPKSKEFVSDSSSDSDASPKSKKAKNVPKKETKKSVASGSKDEETGMYPLSKNRNVSTSTFKNMKLVNIREYYEKDGKLLPGKKGISLTKEQWEKLKSHMDVIDKELDEL